MVDRVNRISLGLILFSALLLRYYVSGGFTSADDASIADIALRWLDHGPYLPDSHYSARVGMIFPLALIFAAFGVGEWQIALIPTAASLGGIVLAYLFAKRLYGEKAGLLAAAVIVVFPLDALFGTRYFPDVIFGTLSAWAVYLIWIATEKNRPLIWALASGLVWGYSYLVKVEAFFLGAAYLALFFEKDRRPSIIVAAAACLAVVFGENLVYFLISGEWLHRLTAILSLKTEMNPDAFKGQMLTYPKSWFLTFYSYGLHYYFMFAGLILMIRKKRPEAALIGFWIGAMLLWLQFGGTVSDGEYNIKSKLLRYNLFITVPMSLAITYTVLFIKERYAPRFGLKPQIVSIGLLLGAGLFFCNFAVLDTEREVSIKKGLEKLQSVGAKDVYMGSASYSIAEIAARVRPFSYTPKLLDDLDLDDPASRDSNGYVFIMLNPSTVKYRKWRYGGKYAGIDIPESCARPIVTISNPLPNIAYAQLRLLKALSAPIPVLGKKISATSDDILDPHDLVIYRLGKGDIDCIRQAR